MPGRLISIYASALRSYLILIRRRVAFATLLDFRQNAQFAKTVNISGGY
jgi:hypothetical protein